MVDGDALWLSSQPRLLTMVIDHRNHGDALSTMVETMIAYIYHGLVCDHG